ncbi:MAG: CBS domain-containing protein [Thaumarchaeota archaeon]|nr:CBS domain-containing protein [Nitrososphaerota archaeon]
MASPPIVISENTTIDEAASIMWEKGVGSLIVVDQDGMMVGIFTERDLVFTVSKSMTGRGVPVSSVMSKTKFKISPNQNLVSAVELMHKAGIKHLPVVDRAGKPVGMISMRDALDISGPVLKAMLQSSRWRRTDA